MTGWSSWTLWNTGKKTWLNSPASKHQIFVALTNYIYGLIWDLQDLHRTGKVVMPNFNFQIFVIQKHTHLYLLNIGWNIHVSVGKVLKVVPPNTLMGVRCQHCSAIAQAPQALHPHTFPGVQQVTIKVLTTNKANVIVLDRRMKTFTSTH